MSIAENTRVSLVYATYRYTPKAYYSAVISGIDNQIVNLQVIDLKIFHKKLATNLIFFTKKIISYYNNYCNIELTLK
jgi:hypothetical protein